MSFSRFCCSLFFSFAGIGATVWIVESFTGLDAGAAVFLVLPLLIAAMFEGQNYAKRHRRYPDATQCWQVALVMGVCVALCTACAGALVWFVYSGDGVAEFFTLNTMTAFGLISIPLLRIGYAIGLASVLKGQETTQV